MSSGKALAPPELRKSIDPAQFSFATTDDLPELESSIGQERPISAIRFGVRMDRPGYNIFALGPSGLGKHTLILRSVDERAAGEPAPSDWCYVNNFDQPHKPKVLRLPTGKGRELRHDIDRFVEDMQTALSAAFESEEYQARRRAIEGEVQERQQASLVGLQEKAKERNLALLRTPAGLAFAPLKDGEVLPPDEYEKRSEEEQKRIQADVEVMQEELQKILSKAPRWERDLRSALRDLNREVAEVVLVDLNDEVAAKYADLPDVLSFIEAIQRDVKDHLGDFLVASEKRREAIDGDGSIGFSDGLSPLRRYQVNLLVDSAEMTGAPVIYEGNPTYLNLIGRIEQMAQMGALFTDFSLIKPGMLHRANGGYLVLDALKVLLSPYAWEGLKRVLQFGEIRIESPLQQLSITTTVSLEPEPIPLDVKVVLMGDRKLYYLLSDADPDFSELFKVVADFSDEVVRDENTQELYAQLIANIVRKEQLKPLNKLAVCRVLDHAARLVSDSERMTAQVQSIVDLLQESDYWAGEAGAEIIGPEHIEQTINAQIFRLDRVAQLLQEEVLRNTIHIETEGAVVGQINGLAVLSLGNYRFGQPSRITATVRMGRGDVVNIEREVNMSGPLHSKGVLILSSFLSARYAVEHPLALSASLVFEQSYAGVDGDSASSAELYVLLSAIADVPIRQSLAVTGSVDQHGTVQAIGGVNEKIEGFFDLCKARGLTGDQGVLIPATNVKHLMLRQEVVDAVAEGKFAIYPVSDVDEGIEILTGMPAGKRGKRGAYPKGTINRRVDERLATMAKKRAEFEPRPNERMNKHKPEVQNPDDTPPGPPTPVERRVGE